MSKPIPSTRLMSREMYEEFHEREWDLAFEDLSSKEEFSEDFSGDREAKWEAAEWRNEFKD